MTDLLFRQDAYLREADAVVVAVSERGGIVLDCSLFYPNGGGQPGDAGRLRFDGHDIEIVTTVKGEGDEVVLVPAEGSTLPAVGTQTVQALDWDKRLSHMRIHTALHLLSVVIPLPVTGGQVSAVKGRLDFDMPNAPDDKQAIEDSLNELISRDLVITEDWITDAELEANPTLVKTMSVKPPRGAGRVRLVRIGTPQEQVDLQPCGGTHVRRTSEIGQVRLGKIEKKGKQNRRVNLHLES
ncbi:MAG: alanyl-tRNA editing protein [Rhodobacteraceae bacterium]|nr:alanyl-tRNA editing protein [Paracoccaceae bacterium]